MKTTKLSNSIDQNLQLPNLAVHVFLLYQEINAQHGTSEVVSVHSTQALAKAAAARITNRRTFIKTMPLDFGGADIIPDTAASVITGEQLDRMANLYGLRPRSVGEPDESVRKRILNQVVRPKAKA